MSRSFSVPLISLMFLLASCNWVPQNHPGTIPSSDATEAEPVPQAGEEPEDQAAPSEEGGLLDDILNTDGKSDEEITEGFLKSILLKMAEQGREKREAMAKQQAYEDSVSRAREAEEKAAREAAWEAGREAQRWWKQDFSITVERPEMMNSRWVVKRKGDRFYQSRTGMGFTQYYVYYNKDGKVGSYSTAERKYNTHPDKDIDVMLEKWLKDVGVFMGYDYVHDYFDNTGQTRTYAGRTVEVWENQKNTVYVDKETGAVLYQKAPKGESTTVKSFSTKADVSDISSHLPKI